MIFAPDFAGGPMGQERAGWETSMQAAKASGRIGLGRSGMTAQRAWSLGSDPAGSGPS